VVPDFAQGRFYFRSPSRDYLDTVLEKAYNCARGAALCTGTEVSWRHHETSFREVRPNAAVEDLAMAVLDELGVPYSKEPHAGGSTDAGDVSWRCPTMHLSFSFIDKEVAAHTREFAAVAADRRYIEPGIAGGAKTLARMGLAVLADPEIRKKIRDGRGVAG
jgi:metal-dependent amidase/aminoacylase/carboxypeptidase family protein